MAKPEWGAKRVCPSCAARFYDLMRDPVPCPACGSVFALDALSERKPATASRARPKPEKAAVVVDEPIADGDDLIDDDAEAAEDDVLLEDEDEDEDADLGEIGDVALDADEEEP
jgi:uncharacterized protein (TIGR02300 family)